MRNARFFLFQFSIKYQTVNFRLKYRKLKRKDNKNIKIKSSEMPLKVCEKILTTHTTHTIEIK